MASTRFTRWSRLPGATPWITAKWESPEAWWRSWRLQPSSCRCRLHDETTFLIEPTDVAKVYATTPGRVSEVFVAPGSRVTKKGDLLVRLTNDEKEQKRRSLEMERDLQQKDVDWTASWMTRPRSKSRREILRRHHNTAGGS